MNSVMKIFYGNDFLPYKDKDRTIHYPIVGNTFNGMNNVNELHFYVRDIGGVNNLSWVAIAKLPNGRILYELLTDVRIDNEIEENYVVFNVSQFYTQLKGEVYISLNGCSGDVEIETDQETGISTISGEIDDNTVVATGSIKLAINYAPQRPLGFSFDVDQYQNIINALANKSNVFNTIQVVATLPSDLTGYNDGQLFYCNGTYYELVETSGVKSINIAEKNGLLGGDHALLRFVIDDDTTLEELADFGKMFVISYNLTPTAINEFLAYVNVVGSTYLLYLLDIQEMKLYSYSGVASDTFADFLDSAEETTYVERQHSANIIYGTNGSAQESALPYGVSASGDNIVQRDNNGQVNVPLSPTQNSHATSKKYIDDLIASIKENAFILVDTTTYPTLNSFLASSGQEGYIYLYPINTSDLTKGYYQYIWESNGWLDIGTTQIDLSNYYTKTQTDTLLNLKANDNIVVKLSGNQTISGVKTFSSSPIVPNPTNNTDATPKSYVDTLSALKVDKTNSANKVYGTDSSGNQKTFDVDNTVGADGNIVRRASSTNQIMVPLTPIANGNASSKKYVDDSIASAISNVYKIKGSKTVAELNALTGQEIGDVYNLLDNGTLNAGNIQVFTGDNVVWLGSAWDKLGTEIDWSAYDEKFMSAGFFEVQNYNESTGEITMVYATELYDMTYNGDTGILSIEAN